ncbi:hypothetical protein D3C87_1223150 [compost metagenome]
MDPSGGRLEFGQVALAFCIAQLRATWFIEVGKRSIWFTELVFLVFWFIEDLRG